MFWRALFVETRKTLRNPALWLGLGGLLFLFTCAVLIRHLQISRGYAGDPGGLESDLVEWLLLFHWIGILVYAVTGAVIAAFDYLDRSIQLWLVRGVRRSVLLCARLTTILVVTLGIVVFSVGTFLGIAALSRSLFFGYVDAAELHLAALPLAVLRVYWSSLPYLALTVLLAVVSRSPFFAAGGTVVYGTVVEPFLPALIGRLPGLMQFVPGSLARTLHQYNAALDLGAAPLATDAALLSQWEAVLLIGVLFLLLSFAALVIFSRQDLGG
jgi:ABC-type transport system involved in multi-copper enzyme maturation permease subunit